MTCRPDGHKHAAFPGQPHEISNEAITSETPAAPATPRPDTSRAAFYGDDRGVRAARRWVAHLVEEQPRANDMETVTTELASNATRHSGSAGALFTVIFEREDDGIVIVVRDRGSTHSEPHTSDPYTDENGCDHGYGMLLVAELADEWGTSANPDGRDTWAWFDSETGGRHVGQ